MIIHIDMDAFFASIEQAVNPRLKGKPLIVGSRNNRLHTVVCAASYEAKAFGIDSGMPSREAFNLCPNLEFVPADQAKYIWTSEQILRLLKAYGFETIYASIDEFEMDIRGTPEPLALAKKLQNRIQETFKITASIGVARNCLLAKLASKINKPKGVLVLTENNLTGVLAKTPLKKLCGMGGKLGEFLPVLGVQNCLDLYQKSSEFLEEKLGKFGVNLFISLHSTDSFGPQDNEEKPKSISHSYTLPRASENPRFIQAWIRLLADMVARRLRQDNLVAKTVHLWLNGPEIGNFGAQKTFQQATSDDYEIYQRSLKIMAKTGPRMPKIRALGVTCSQLSPACYAPLFKEQKRREELLKTLDRINDRHGDGAIYPAVIKLTRKFC